MDEEIRLQKFLSMSGRASRREAERLIVAGRVRVNGEAVMELGTRVSPSDVVELDGERVVPAQERWIAFHKPPGILTTRSDPHGGRTVYDLLPEDLSGLRYVGRLDRPTEGLLVMGSDGDVIERLLRPATGVEREYLVTVKGRPTPATFRRLREGVDLDDGPACAKRVTSLRQEGRNGVLTLTLTEGRKREVRRMMEAVGHPVVRLVRVRFGTVELDDLRPGAWRPLRDEETRSLRSLAEGSVTGRPERRARGRRPGGARGRSRPPRTE